MTRYAARWQYPFWVGSQALLQGIPNDGPGSETWTKIALTHSILLNELRNPSEERLEWIYFIDADSVITNHNIPLTNFLPPEDDARLSQIVLIVSLDQWGMLNTGGYFLRVCRESLRFLLAVQGYALSKNRLGDEASSEQDGVARVASSIEYRDRTAIVPAEWFNADAYHLFQIIDYFDIANPRAVYHLGDFMIHFMGDNKTGWEEMLDAAEATPANRTLHVPLHLTRLYTEPRLMPSRFWYRWLNLSDEDRWRVLGDVMGK